MVCTFGIRFPVRTACSFPRHHTVIGAGFNQPLTQSAQGLKQLECNIAELSALSSAEIWNVRNHGASVVAAYYKCYYYYYCYVINFGTAHWPICLFIFNDFISSSRLCIIECVSDQRRGRACGKKRPWPSCIIPIFAWWDWEYPRKALG